MILNFLRVAECPLAYMVSSSYSEYHSQKANARDIIAASKLRSTIETVRQSINVEQMPLLKMRFARCQQFWRNFGEIQEILVEHDRQSHRFFDNLLQCGRIVRIRDLYEIDVPAMILDGTFTSTGKSVRIISVLVIHRSKPRLLTDIDRLIFKENPQLFVLSVEKWKLKDQQSNVTWTYQIKNIPLTDILDVTDQIISNIKYRDILEAHWHYRTGDEVEIDLNSTMADTKGLRQAIERLDLLQQNFSNRSSNQSVIEKAIFRCNFLFLLFSCFNSI